jgi:hypothetical protein
LKISIIGLLATELVSARQAFSCHSHLGGRRDLQDPELPGCFVDRKRFVANG